MFSFDQVNKYYLFRVHKVISNIFYQVSVETILSSTNTAKSKVA